MSDLIENVGQEQIDLLVDATPVQANAVTPPSAAMLMMTKFAALRDEYRRAATQNGIPLAQADAMAFADFEESKKMERVNATRVPDTKPMSRPKQVEAIYNENSPLGIVYPIGDVNPHVTILRHVDDRTECFKRSFETFMQGHYYQKAIKYPHRAQTFAHQFRSALREGMVIVEAYSKHFTRAEEKKWTASCVEYMQNLMALTLNWSHHQSTREEAEQAIYQNEQANDGVQMEEDDSDSIIATKLSRRYTNIYEHASVKVATGQTQKRTATLIGRNGTARKRTREKEV